MAESVLVNRKKFISSLDNKLVEPCLLYTSDVYKRQAIYLTEYARNRRLVAAIEFATETLTGIPSIIFGLVGMLFFIQLVGWQTGVLAGGLTLVVMILPTIIRTTQESLKTVPQSYREGALGLGAGKLKNRRQGGGSGNPDKAFYTATDPHGLYPEVTGPFCLVP